MTTTLREETFEEWQLVIKYDEEVFDPLFGILMENIEKRLDYVIEKLDSHDDKIKISTLKQVKEILK